MLIRLRLRLRRRLRLRLRLRLRRTDLASVLHTFSICVYSSFTILLSRKAACESNQHLTKQLPTKRAAGMTVKKLLTKHKLSSLNFACRLSYILIKPNITALEDGGEGAHCISLDLTWTHLISLEFTCGHLESLGHTWTHSDHLDSLGCTWTIGQRTGDSR